MKLTANLFSNAILLLLIASVILSTQSCSTDDDLIIPDEEMENEVEQESEDEEDESSEFVLERLSGSTQKGPYTVGAIITLHELDEDLIPTGRSFTTEITNNIGHFQFDKLSLASPYVELRANGFYYNEVTDNISDSQLGLSALVDLTNEESANINVLTTLENDRVKFLIDDGSSFQEAKLQAASEVLEAFYQETTNVSNSEDLDITNPGANHAVLLAISAIMQGNLSVGELSQLTAKIKNDLTPDGLLDDQNTCIQLSSNASLIDPIIIKDNLDGWYDENSVNASVPDFQEQVSRFIQNTPCLAAAGITYPESGRHGYNLLAPGITTYEVDEDYSLAAELEEGSSLKVRIIGFNWVFSIGQTETGWHVGDWENLQPDLLDSGREFTSARVGALDFEIILREGFGSVVTDELTFEIYENGSSTPTRVKVIKINGIDPFPSSPFELLLGSGSQGEMRSNLIARQFFAGNINDSSLETDTEYGLALWLPKDFTVEYILSGRNFEISNANLHGWQIEDNSSGIDKSYKLTASGYGYYQADLDFVDNIECAIINMVTHINGEPYGDYRLSSFELVEFWGSNNILDKSAEFQAGSAVIFAQLYHESIFRIEVSGAGWKISDNPENEYWEVGTLDPSQNKQTFIADSGKAFEFNINLDIEPYSVPPQILVEVFLATEDCSEMKIESYYLNIKD